MALKRAVLMARRMAVEMVLMMASYMVASKEPKLVVRLVASMVHLWAAALGRRKVRSMAA